MEQMNQLLQSKVARLIDTATKFEFWVTAWYVMVGVVKPILSCGARVVIETENEVEILR